MKFMHLGDLHIGKTLGDFDLYNDQEYILNQILRIALENNVDSILLAGDIYDKAIPTESAVRLFDSFLCRLSENRINTFIISGNHDSDERLNYGSALFAANNVYISAKFDGKLKFYTLKDEFGEINIYLMPYVKASQVKRYYPDADITTYDDAVSVVIENANIDTSLRNIIVAHQFVTGKSGDPSLSGSEGLAVKSVGTVEKIGAERLDKFDYAALGHIHSAQSVGRDEVRYSGSMLKYSLSEANSDKSVPIITINEKGNIKIDLIKLTPLRDLRHIKGTLKNLLDKKNVSDTDDFMYVTLTDEEPVNDVMGIIQQIYPNTVKVDYDNSHTHEVTGVDIAQITQGRSFKEMISDFYTQMYGCDILDEELNMLTAIAREAGVADEAN